jgi:hypothetical protein
MWIRTAALLALVAFLWSLFRLAMGLRWSKVCREEESRGRRIVAELPSADGRLGFFAEDHAGFYWPRGEAGKSALRGARLLLNRGVIAAAARAGQGLPDPPVPEPFEGRERWEVALYLAGGESRLVDCGTLREGVSREIASRVFEAVRATVDLAPTGRAAAEGGA